MMSEQFGVSFDQRTRFLTDGELDVVTGGTPLPHNLSYS